MSKYKLSDKKTFKEWFNLFADTDIRDRAIRNCKKLNDSEKLYNCVISAFYRSNTPEWHMYWREIQCEIRNWEFKFKNEVLFDL